MIDKRFLITVFIFLNTINSSCQENKTSYAPIDISAFRSSTNHWYNIKDEIHLINPIPDQKQYERNEITKIADNILLYQKSNGGWPKNYDMLAILTAEQKDTLLEFKDELNSTFDNGATYSQIEYLAEVYVFTKEEKYKSAILKGIEFILSAQYTNGGWPQFYPDTSGYRKYITFNDGAMMGVVNLLDKIAGSEDDFLFIDDELRTKVKSALDKSIDCILECQIIDNGKLTAWCQQHDNINFHPQWARTFEPPAICNMESVDIVKFLMSISNPNEKIINSIQSALKWFDDSKIYGIRYINVNSAKENFIYHKADYDRITVKDPNAPPIWARYYELETHRPIFCNRDGKPVYSLEEVDKERRTGYAWYTDAPEQILKLYPEWQKKWAPDKNVLELK